MHWYVKFGSNAKPFTTNVSFAPHLNGPALFPAVHEPKFVGTLSAKNTAVLGASATLQLKIQSCETGIDGKVNVNEPYWSLTAAVVMLSG